MRVLILGGNGYLGSNVHNYFLKRKHDSVAAVRSAKTQVDLEKKNYNPIKLYNEAFIKTFGIKESKLKKLKYQSIKSWDSVGHMSIMSVLEKKFNIELDIDDIIDFSSYEKGKRILKKYKLTIK